MVKNLRAISFFALSLSCSGLAICSSSLDSSVDFSLNESGLRQQASFDGHLNSSDVKSEERLTLISNRYATELVKNRQLSEKVEELMVSERAAVVRKESIEKRFASLMTETRVKTQEYEHEKCRLENQIKSLTDKIQSLEDHNKADLLRADSAKADLKIAQDELVKVRAHLETANTRLEDMNDIKALLEKQIKENDGVWKREKAEYIAALELAKGELMQVKENFELSEQTVDGYFDEIEKLKQAVASKDSIIAELSSKELKLLGQVDQLTATTEEIQKRVAELSTRVAADGTPKAVTPKKTPQSRSKKVLSNRTNKENAVPAQLGKDPQLKAELIQVIAKKALAFTGDSDKSTENPAIQSASNGYGLMAKAGATAVVGVAAYWAYNHFQSK